MAPSVTVLVHVDGVASGLATTVAALDAQTLPTAEFDVVFTGPAIDGSTQDRLEELSRRRPNMRVRPGEPAAVVASLESEWVLLLDPDDAAAATLRPAALERLVQRGVDTASDLVLGRVDVADGRAVDDLLVRDAAPVAATAETVQDALVLERRTVALEHGLVVDAAAATKVLDATQNLATLGSYQCLSRRRAPAAPAPEAPEITASTAQWDEGTVVIEVHGSCSPVPDAEVVVAARGVASKMDHRLPAAAAVHPDGQFSVTARFDPRTAAAGQPIEDGRWTVTLGVHGTMARRSGRRTLPSSPHLPSAIVSGRPIVVEADAATLTFDVGATRTSIVGRLTAGDVTIAESARGTMLSAPLPRVTTWTQERVRGTVLLDKFALPAYLVAAEGTARLECYLSGLAGHSVVSTRFGRATAPTGLDLDISGTGVMSVRPHRKVPQRQPAKAAQSQPAKPPPPAASRSTVQRLRRAVPAPLEPAVRSMARSPALRRLYRKLAALPNR